MSFTQSLFLCFIRVAQKPIADWRESKQCLDLELTGTNKFHYFAKGKYHSKNRTPFHSDYEITIIRINRVIRT